MSHFKSEDPDYVLLTAKQDDMLVGFCLGIVCHTLYGDCSSFMVIEDFIVDKKYRRRGIGLALLKALVNRARELGAANVYLGTSPRLTAAICLYTGLGFRRVTQSPLNIEIVNRPSIVMQLTLSDYDKTGGFK